MQDRFKFRTYIPDLKFFKYWGWVEKGHFVGLCASGDFSTDELLEKYTNQCTGLRDKNGKLVYEGDIVNYDDRDLDPSHKPILNAVIELRKYQWCMVYYRKDIIDAHTRKPAKRKTWLGFDDFISSRIEVIGNIYKNKELLEG